MKHLARCLLVVGVLGATTWASAEEPQEHGGQAAEHGAGLRGAGLRGAGLRGAGHHGIDATKLALQLLNFGVLLFVLIKFGGGAMNKALGARHEQLKQDLEEATALKTAAEGRLAENQGRLANIEREIAAMRASIRQEAELEQSRLVAAAEERAKRVQQETTFLLEQLVKEAEARFRHEVSEAALKVAEDALRRAVTEDDEQRLATSFVADLLRRDDATGGTA